MRSEGLVMGSVLMDRGYHATQVIFCFQCDSQFERELESMSLYYQHSSSVHS